jgi:hypothetical protein
VTLHGPRATTIACAIMVVVAFPNSANAEALRCGQHLVDRGLELYEVIERCGEPVDQRSYVFYRGYDVGYFETGPVQVDELIYEVGSNKFRRKLRFEDGQLRRIETLRKPLPG